MKCKRKKFKFQYFRVYLKLLHLGYRVNMEATVLLLLVHFDFGIENVLYDVSKFEIQIFEYCYYVFSGLKIKGS